MSNILARDGLTLVPLESAHAGDLIGFTKHGYPLYLPGGGARDGQIQAGPDDDDIGDPGDDDDDDTDDLDDLDDGSPDDDDYDPDEPYRRVVAENKKLKAAVARNNKELRDRRLLGEAMKKHGITDLDAWLNDKGMAATPPAVTPPAAPAVPEPVAPAAPPTGETPNPRLELELAKAQEAAKTAQEAADARIKAREDKLRDTAMQLALNKIGFRGTYATARRVLDLDSLEVDDDGEVSGAEEAAKELAAELPEWFKPARAGARSGGSDVDGPDRRSPAPAAKSWDQRIADQIAGRR